MSKIHLLRAGGLDLNSNPIGEAPYSALTKAENVLIVRPGIIESRPGFDTDYVGAYYVNAITNYDGGIVGHSSPQSQLTCDSNVLPDPVSAPPGSRMRFARANKNLYFTSAAGIMKMSGFSTTPYAAGGLIPRLPVVTQGTGSFLTTATDKVAYRAIIGFVDAKENLVLGRPSGTAEFLPDTATGTTTTPSIKVSLPAGCTTNHFLQLYRTKITARANSFADELFQVYEKALTSADIAAGFITIIDSTVDALTGAALYTNASQDGEASVNEVPPYAIDLANFAGCLMAANTKTRHQLVLTLLSGDSGLEGKTLTIVATDGSSTTLTFKASPSAATDVKLYYGVTGYSVAERVTYAARALIDVICAQVPHTQATYLSGSDDYPGQILIESTDVAASSAISVTSNAGDKFNPPLPTTGTSVESSNNEAKNRMCWSKPYEPEAFPPGNYVDIGMPEFAILKMVPFRDSLLIFKEEGLWRMTGSSPENFTVELYDSSVHLVGSDTPAVVGNKVYAMTMAGVIEASEYGVRVVSTPINSALLQQIIGHRPGLDEIHDDLDIPPTYSSSAIQQFRFASFGVADDSRGLYLLFFPALVDQGPGKPPVLLNIATHMYGDIVTDDNIQCSESYVLNVKTGGWVRWTRPAMCGVLNENDNRIVLGGSVSGATCKERVRGTPLYYSDDTVGVVDNLTTPLSTMQTLEYPVIGSRGSSWISPNGDVVPLREDGSVERRYLPLLYSTGPWTIVNNILRVIEWTPQTAASPGTQKEWHEAIVFLHESTATTFQLSFRSDASPEPETVGIQVTPGKTFGMERTYVPTQKQRNGQLIVQLFHPSAGENLSLTGVGLVFDDAESQVSR